MRRLLYLISILFLFGYTSVEAFDNRETHPALTDSAVRQVRASLDSHFKDKLILPQGLDTPLHGRPTLDWLTFGADREDVPICRASNHFHNPRNDLSWTESGMSDEPWYVSLYCVDIPVTSAVAYATAYREPAPGGVKVTGGTNERDWDHAREFYYMSLTGRDFQGRSEFHGEPGIPEALGLNGDEKRHYYMAMSAWSLGQVLHLLQDMAVPSHVRNDFKAHLDWKGITLSTWYRPKEWVYERFEDYVKVNGVAGTASGGDLSEKSVTRFWDTNNYDGTNPGISLNAQAVGLAEYTNINFVSGNTILAEDYLSDEDSSNDVHYQPYPRKSSTNLQYYLDGVLQPQMVVGEDNKPDTSFYIAKTGDGEAIAHFLKPSYLTIYFSELDPLESAVSVRTLLLDEECLKEYASKLLPRAVGYSAALLNYFFRGQLEITAPPEFVYSIIDGLNAAQGFRFIKARVRNATAGEEATNDAGQPGQLVAIAQYRLRTNYQADLSADPPTMDSRDEYYSYSVSAPLQVESLTSGSPGLECTFDFTANPIPPGITDLYLKVVYKGKLGAEQDAVAVGMKDLCEPQHLSYWNSTDYFLLNGELRKAEEIENDPNVEDYDFFRPVSISEELGFSGSAPGAGTPMVVSVQDMPPARYFRVILLTDVPGGYYVRDHLVSKPYPPGWPYPDDFTVDNGLWTYDMPSVVYQELDGPLWKDTPVYQYRGIIQHQMSYFIRYYPYYIYNADQFPAPPENAEGPYPVTINFP
ncbi:hypothetical protein Sfum_2355 [Syntrophobacter fumaroxidans MPOB]|uniref:Zn-dependent PLC domain-containing protein n=2 Tax=Syntrophobacter TaxID=29526 RepID=A0LKT4_SYNFM|nr:hypothetical protein Sfum_2355 [Syntrophobacter fumaroxidans MPOB]